MKHLLTTANSPIMLSFSSFGLPLKVLSSTMEMSLSGIKREESKGRESNQEAERAWRERLDIEIGDMEWTCKWLWPKSRTLRDGRPWSEWGPKVRMELWERSRKDKEERPMKERSDTSPRMFPWREREGEVGWKSDMIHCGNPHLSSPLMSL